MMMTLKQKKCKIFNLILAISIFLFVFLTSYSVAAEEHEGKSNLDRIEKLTSSKSKKTKKKSKKKYVSDKVVNNFIAAYNKVSGSPFTSFENGNIRTKFFTYSYDYYYKLLHAGDTEKIVVTINGDDTKGIDGMRQAFRDTVKAVDSQLSDEEIYSLFDNAILNDIYLETKIGSKINVRFNPDTMTYREFIEVSEK